MRQRFFLYENVYSAANIHFWVQKCMFSNFYQHLPNTLFHIRWCGRSVGGQRFPSLGLYYGTVFQIEQKNDKEKEKEKD